MECKPQVSKDSFQKLDMDGRMDILYDMQSITMECIQKIDERLDKRKLIDRISIIAGGVIGGILGALGLNQVK